MYRFIYPLVKVASGISPWQLLEHSEERKAKSSVNSFQISIFFVLAVNPIVRTRVCVKGSRQARRTSKPTLYGQSSIQRILRRRSRVSFPQDAAEPLRGITACIIYRIQSAGAHILLSLFSLPLPLPSFTSILRVDVGERNKKSTGRGGEDLREFLGEVGIHSAELPERRGSGGWLERVEVPHERGWEFARTAVI